MIDNLMPYLCVSAVLFALGFAVVVTKKNLVLMLMGVEMMLNAVNINFAIFSKFDNSAEQGQIFSIFIMIVAAAEIAVGLAIALKVRKYYQEIDPEKLNSLRN
jgi:NAD(P)H-quinone oxidoreductase subunit 4L